MAIFRVFYLYLGHEDAYKQQNTNKTGLLVFGYFTVCCVHVNTFKDKGLGGIDMRKCALNENLSFSAIKGCVLSCMH